MTSQIWYAPDNKDSKHLQEKNFKESKRKPEKILIISWTSFKELPQ